MSIKETIIKHAKNITDRETLIQTVINETGKTRRVIVNGISEAKLTNKYKNCPRIKTNSKYKNINKKISPKLNELPKKNFINTNTLDKFREEHDYSVIIPKKIEKGIEKYLTTPDGKGAFLEDLKFRDLLGISSNVWRRYAKKFEHLQARHDGILYWGHPNIVDEMREAITNG